MISSLTGESPDLLGNEIRPWVESFLAVRGLALSEEKTRITHINDGFDFLGWNFRKYSGKLLIKPSKKNAQAFYHKVKETISANKTAKQEDLIRLLNPMLRGWAQYHSPVVAKASYSRMEHLVFHALWRWAVRRHRGKNAIWIRRKYFRSVGGQNWVFGATVKGEGGEQQPRDLYSLSAMTIERHAKVKGEYNPFDQLGKCMEKLYASNARSIACGTKANGSHYINHRTDCVRFADVKLRP